MRRMAPMAYTAICLRIDEHREDLLKLWRENFDSQVSDVADARFAWLYHHNPLGPAQTWLAVETASHTLIGCGSVFPSNKQIGGAVVRTGIAVDFAVDRKHRTAGVALAIQRALTSGSRPAGFDCVIGRPNRKALPIFDRVGYRPIGESHAWVKSTHTEFALHEHGERPYTDEFVAVADRRFDELWDARKPACRIVGEKTAAYLNWRYAACTEQNYRFYCLLDRENRQLAGYIVFCVTEKGSIIAELFSGDPSDDTLNSLLCGFASRMRMEGREWIGLTYLGAPSFEDRLKQLGFSQNARVKKLVAYVDPDLAPDLREKILDSDNWLMFAGEMDLF
jgi:hypothetical protein